jgi:hypothetical protein
LFIYFLRDRWAKEREQRERERKKERVEVSLPLQNKNKNLKSSSSFFSLFSLLHAFLSSARFSLSKKN